MSNQPRRCSTCRELTHPTHLIDVRVNVGKVSEFDINVCEKCYSEQLEEVGYKNSTK